MLSGRSEKHVKYIEEYLRTVKMLRNYNDSNQDPVFSEVVTLDLATVVSSVSGPKRPHDRVSVSDMKNDFLSCLSAKVYKTATMISEALEWDKHNPVTRDHLNRQTESCSSHIVLFFFSIEFENNVDYGQRIRR